MCVCGGGGGVVCYEIYGRHRLLHDSEQAVEEGEVHRMCSCTSSSS